MLTFWVIFFPKEIVYLGLGSSYLTTTLTYCINSLPMSEAVFPPHLIYNFVFRKSPIVLGYELNVIGWLVKLPVLVLLTTLGRTPVALLIFLPDFFNVKVGLVCICGEPHPLYLANAYAYSTLKLLITMSSDISLLIFHAST